MVSHNIGPGHIHKSGGLPQRQPRLPLLPPVEGLLVLASVRLPGVHRHAAHRAIFQRRGEQHAQVRRAPYPDYHHNNF